ncbi:hypothetical protein [Priestia megaterium]|uniref:hypothetical protein n=1 Tax=Priestia megaterium TaxID=1404 RepID=UPI000D525342|nr:hypothetical protein [Priestia megaterium]PVE62911.1 hypothetical protein DC428_25325 [Priestia megaterium]PVE79543.1 hypothetical protein DC421_25245 [Priestia megaterium]PVE81855.1 hypothetical protein DC426_23980 [Priestia megaterium]PVE94272.1 hypothetical protein DC433_25805 [Priestia megaterium]
MKKKYEVTFKMVNGEIGHLIEETSLIRAKNSIKNKFEDGEDSPVIELADDLVIVKANVQYFTVSERD